MLVYGDRDRIVAPQQALEALREGLQAVGRSPAGVERHAALVELFIDAAGLAQGLADAEFEALGLDELSPVQDAAMALVMALARRVAASWRSGFRDPGRGGEAQAERLAAMSPRGPVRIRTPEGYAFYAAYPEAWLEAAERLGWRGARVIGLRSIGTGLAAMTAVGPGSGPPFTLRPCGQPFRRELRLGPRLRAALLDGGGGFMVADEGPGLSGSSFGAVADWLEAQGAPSDRIAFLPSHAGAPGPEASDRRRRRWPQARREVADLAEGLPVRLAQWFEDLAGVPAAPLQDISAGRWRALRPGAPAAFPGQERRKLLLRTGRGTWLLKFAGLGAVGRGKLARAQALAEAGFAPAPLGLRHGFLAERWHGEARPADLQGADRRPLLRTLGRYLAFRARAFPAAPGAGEAGLAEMVRVNASELMGAGAGAALADRFGRLAAEAAPARPVMVDGRLHAWEWLKLPDGRLLKADALDHAEAHDLVGPQDIAWDVAGAAVELGLSPEELAGLDACVQADPRRLAAMRIAYPAFQAGLWSFAAAAAAPADAPAIEALIGLYRCALERALAEAPRPAAALSG